MFGGIIYPNNTAVILEHIGEEDKDSLKCTTVHNHCCKTNEQGKFYYPNGEPVLPLSQASSSRQSLYQTRNNGSISLKRQAAGEIFPPLGRYQCEIPDGRGTLQTLYITIGEAVKLSLQAASHFACLLPIFRNDSRTRYGMSNCSRLSDSTTVDLST